MTSEKTLALAKAWGSNETCPRCGGSMAVRSSRHAGGARVRLRWCAYCRISSPTMEIRISASAYKWLMIEYERVRHERPRRRPKPVKLQEYTVKDVELWRGREPFGTERPSPAEEGS
jgi:hypothetical protein